MDYTALRDTVLKLKERIIKTEVGDTQLSETDTRQGLINPLFRALQWDFTDFDSIRSELRVPQFNEAVDYAFFSLKKQSSKPILLLEAKRLGSTIDHKNHVKQLTSYLGATGVQWGVLSDGNRYVLYNSLGGASFAPVYRPQLASTSAGPHRPADPRDRSSAPRLTLISNREPEPGQPLGKKCPRSIRPRELS